MTFDIIPTPDFEKSFKALFKRYRSLATDIVAFEASLIANPYQGVELCPGIRKIRMAITSKGRGKSGGARVITYMAAVDETSGNIYLIDIYDKSDYSTVDTARIRSIIAELNL